MEYSEQKLDDIELHMVDLGATLENIANKVRQLAIAANARTRENVVDDEDEMIESTPTFDEFIPSEYEGGRNGEEK